MSISKIKALLPIVITASAAMAPPTVNALDTFVKIDDVKGSVTVKGHEDDIDVVSWAWGGSRPRQPDGVPGSLNLVAVSITKRQDKASSVLLQRILQRNNHFNNVELVTYVDAANLSSKVSSVKLTNAFLVSVDVGQTADQEGAPLENLAFDFQEICIKTFAPGKPTVSHGFDTVQNTIVKC